MSDQGLNPERAEDDFVKYSWGVAWWNGRSQEWLLDSARQTTKEEAEGYRKYLLSLDPDIPHRLVRVTDHVSYEEAGE